MFRRLLMAIFRLYMKYLLSSYTKHSRVCMGKGGGKVGTRSRICQKVWAVWVARGVHAVTKLCLSLLQLHVVFHGVSVVYLVSITARWPAKSLRKCHSLKIPLSPSPSLFWWRDPPFHNLTQAVLSHLPSTPPTIINVVTIPPETSIKFASTSSGAHQDCPISMAQILWTCITLNFITANVVEGKYHTAEVAKQSIAFYQSIMARCLIYRGSLLVSIKFYIPPQQDQ